MRPLGQMDYGVLADAFNSGRYSWWMRRAQYWENAKPREGDDHGRATHEELDRRWHFCDGVARACRAKAELCLRDYENGVFDELVADLTWGGAA